MPKINSFLLNGEKTCIVIAGPTAAGKTAFAIQLAQHFNTQIISADSRQCFKELNIGVAKPSAAELKTVPHYFINSHSIHDDVNAAVFEKYALQKATEIFATNNVAIMVGGTGLYIKAFCEGVDEIPPIKPEIRTEIINSYTANGLEWLQQQIQKTDSDYFVKGEKENPQRLMRALEVKLSTGNSITHYQTKQKKERDFAIIKVALELPREQLYERINNRVDDMITEGLEEEAKTLLSQRKLNALQTVGYKEWFDYFDGTNSKERAVDLIKQNTRHYAKRQLTWFKNQEEWKWVNPHLSVKDLLTDI